MNDEERLRQGFSEGEPWSSRRPLRDAPESEMRPNQRCARIVEFNSTPIPTQSPRFFLGRAHASDVLGLERWRKRRDSNP